MRTIKFKAKRVDTGKWVFGDLHYTDGGVFIGHHYVTEHFDEGKQNAFMWVLVIPETVCQFTGLLDKNGVEIYEGDIFENTSFKYEVIFVDGAFKLNHLDRVIGLWGNLENLFKPSMNELLNTTHLTGNIHDKQTQP